MKWKMLLLTLALLVSLQCYSQPGQKKALLKQIAALRVYGAFLSKGYSIAKKGLKTIGDLKNGELNLHSTFYSALKKVNPTIRNYEKVGSIVELQLKITKQCNILESLLSDDLFYGDEVAYVKRVFSRLINDCDDSLEVLLLIISDTSLEMDDEERLKRIDVLYEQMLNNYTFSKHFSAEVTTLLKSRERDHKDINSSRLLYQIPLQP